MGTATTLLTRHWPFAVAVTRHAHHSNGHWYTSATFFGIAGVAGTIVGVIGVVTAVLAWRWSVRQVGRESTAKEQVETALSEERSHNAAEREEERQRTARYQFLTLPPRLLAAELALGDARERFNRADVRRALTDCRTHSSEIRRFLGTPGLLELDPGGEASGELSELLLLIDGALGDLAVPAISVMNATERVPYQLSRAAARVAQITTTITLAP